MKGATEWVWGYIAALAVKEVKHLAGHDFGVGVLYRLHLAVHHTLVLALFVDRVDLRDKRALRQSRVEHVLLMKSRKQTHVQVNGENAHESLDARDFQSEADSE